MVKTENKDNTFKTILENYKNLYKEYFNFIYGTECRVEDDNTFMITALIRAIRTIEKELKEEQEKLNKKVETFISNLKEDE